MFESVRAYVCYFLHGALLNVFVERKKMGRERKENVDDDASGVERNENVK